jgi:RNAse (barnase) inhibitor barstar
MTAFSEGEENERRLDWTILRDGSIALYRRDDFLEEAVNWLSSHGYRIVSFDCSDWCTSTQMHDSLQHSLSFPSYYGGNLNALNDCMCEDLEVPEVGGLVLVLRHYDRYSNGTHAAHNSGRSEAEIVLDIFARASRYQMLKGRRLITLAQSGDPLIHFDNLDGVSATWNSREWLNENRNL